MALKIGVEDRKKVAIASALGLIVLLLAVHTIFGGDDTPPPVPASAGPAQSVVRTSPSNSARRTSSNEARYAVSVTDGDAASGSSHLDPTLHPELMAETESFLYAGNGRNIFSMNSMPTPISIERVKGPVRPTVQAPVAPAGPPPPPAIDLRFFGLATTRAGDRKAFLLHGDDVFIAQEGDVVSHRYRVVKIAPFSIMVEDLPYHNTQSLPLVQN